MGRLTTHVLDTARGRPAAGLRIELFRIAQEARMRLAEVETNADGRTDGPLLEGEALLEGGYELLFHAGAYFDGLDLGLPSPKFLEDIPIRFGISDRGAHHHVPLLLSPYGYSTYRGS
jgi:5-hydroxyisourate hydrolase